MIEAGGTISRLKECRVTDSKAMVSYGGIKGSGSSGAPATRSRGARRAAEEVSINPIKDQIILGELTSKRRITFSH